MSDDPASKGFLLVDLLKRLATWQEATPTRGGEALSEPLDGGPEPHIVRLTSLETLTGLPEEARVGSAVVLADHDDLERYLALGEPRVGLLVAPRDAEPPTRAAGVTVVTVDSTRLALATLSAAFDARPRPPAEVHASAHVAADASLPGTVSIGPGAVVSAGVSLGDGCRVGANCFIGPGVVLGAGCVLHPNVTVYDGVRLGERVILHAGAVIGADGFGYAASPRGAIKIRHLGGVRLGDDVEVGANSAVDRGTLDDTVVGPRTKIDNLCQIGHNVQIGSDCLIAGMTGVAGSVAIGDGVIVGGAVGIADHVTIGSGARIAGRSGVTKDVPAGETWAGFPARPYRQYARGLYLRDRLERMWQHVKAATREEER